MQARVLDKQLSTVDLLGKWKQMSACVSFAIHVVYQCALFQAKPHAVDALQPSVAQKEKDKMPILK